MACDLTQGYTLDCRDSKGGVKRALIAQLEHVSSTTESNGTISGITMSGSTNFWEYELETQTANFTENINASRENNTVFYQTELQIILNKGNVTTRNELLLLAQNRLAIIVEDRNGKYWFFGKNNGAMLGESSWASGTAMGDRNGYEINITAIEENPAFEVDSGIISGLLP